MIDKLLVIRLTRLVGYLSIRDGIKVCSRYEVGLTVDGRNIILDKDADGKIIGIELS